MDLSKVDFPQKNNMMTALGMEVVEMTKDRVILTMPVADATKQPFGLLHGGASVALAETAASFASWMNIDQQRQAAVGLEINANHLRSKTDGIVKAVALPLHRGRATMVWEVRITDEAGKLVCISRCTVAVVDQQPLPEHKSSTAQNPMMEQDEGGTTR